MAREMKYRGAHFSSSKERLLPRVHVDARRYTIDRDELCTVAIRGQISLATRQFARQVQVLVNNNRRIEQRARASKVTS